MTASQRLLRLVCAGLLSGLVVLGVGGRLAMRVVAYTGAEPPEFTLSGTGQVLLVAAGWGALTAPLLLPLEPLRRRHVRAIGPVFGLAVMTLAGLTIVLVTDGRIVAPPAFILSSALLFPLLFVVHGTVVGSLARRWRAWAFDDGSPRDD